MSGLDMIHTCPIQDKDSSGKLIPLGNTTLSAYTRLQVLMQDPKTIIVEARATPHVPRRPEWCRWGERGLQTTWDPRYYYFSAASYGSGGDTENWLGNRHEQQPELGSELVNAEQGIRFLGMELARGRTVLLLCPRAAKKDAHGQMIIALLRKRLPRLQVSSLAKEAWRYDQPQNRTAST
jgi:hypothetical protein